jgi:hypothetical protein
MSVYSCVSPAIAALRLAEVAPLALRGRAENRGDVVVAFDVGLLGEVEIPAVRLALAREGCLQIVLGLGSLEVRHNSSPCCLLEDV